MDNHFAKSLLALAFTLASMSAASAWELADCQRYRAAIDNQAENVTLEIAGGKPVAYRTDGGYVARNVRLSGATIHIDKATLRVQSYGPKRFSGDWTLRSYRQSDVLFTCRE